LEKPTLEATHLKDIMIHSRKHHNADLVIRVQPSRFRIILSNILALNAIEVEGYLDRMCREYNYFIVSSEDIGDHNNNRYTIVKTFEKEDAQYKCSQCDCGEPNGRFVNAETGVCFYKEYMTYNYTTTIPK